MTLRPPRRPFSVSRQLSERARAARAAAAPPEAPADPAITGSGGFAGMVGALRGLVEQLAATARQQADTSSHTPPEAPSGPTGGSVRSFTLGGENARVVFGYTLRMGEDGISAEPFGNVPAQASPAAQAAQATRPLQPIVEVYQDGDTVVVIAELPGADPDRIVCQPDGVRLVIEATGRREYRKELTLPVPVRSDGMVRSIQNGILEVRLTRAATP